MIRSGILFILIIFSISVYSQNPKKFIREGNKLYEQKKYNDAEVQYRKSLTTDTNYVTGQYNLANSLYKQKNYDEANKIYSSLSDKETNKNTKSKILHNLGNTYLQKKEYEKCVDTYKQALRNNPKDEDTRYNLAYAMKMLKQQQQNKQNKNNKDNKDNKDKKDKDKQNKDNKDNKDKDKQDQKQNQDQDKDKKQDQQKQKMKKEEADRMLEALKNDEKKTLDKVKKEKAVGVKVKIEKDW
ncbi:MAG: tetratricopeptide repeat protein [Bacteroidota bacterium]